jgi:hypothetical protein
LWENKKGIDVSASVKVNYNTDKGKYILEAISPDNYDAPEGVKVKAKVEGSTLELTISCSKSIGSLLATVDDLLSCIQAADEALTEVVEL